jgi:hypothetical protein
MVGESGTQRLTKSKTTHLAKKRFTTSATWPKYEVKPIQQMQVIATGVALG